MMKQRHSSFTPSHLALDTGNEDARPVQWCPSLVRTAGRHENALRPASYVWPPQDRRNSGLVVINHNQDISLNNVRDSLGYVDAVVRSCLLVELPYPLSREARCGFNSLSIP